MGKQRFREVKQNRPQKETSKSDDKPEQLKYASAGLKIKAFLTDAFMLLMPILYGIFYLVMDGREDFAAHKILGWFSILLPLVLIQTLFMYLSGQTPGYRAYHMTLIDEKTQAKPSFFAILFRNVAAILSFITFIGWILMFFRKDSKTLHDLLSKTAVVQIR